MKIRYPLIIASTILLIGVYSSDTDIGLLKTINLNRNTSLDFLFDCMTNSVAPIAYGIPFILLIASLTNENIEQQKHALSMIGYVLSAALIATVVKHGFDRPRPFITYTFLQSISDGGSPSFPSGHTCDAFAFLTAITLTYKKWFIVIPVFLWAFMVAYSRMHLGVHYPSDILGGIIIGSGVPLIFPAIIKRFRKGRN
jgi:undecaprenyl-diphosphatase